MTAVQKDVKRSRPASTWKRLGVAFLAVPLMIFTVFSLAEGVGGEEGWWGHVIQLAIAIALLVGAWFVPKVFGPLLVLLGIAPVVAMLVAGASVGVVGSSVLLVWLPLMLSGVFFTLAGYRRHPTEASPPEPEARPS